MCISKGVEKKRDDMIVPLYNDSPVHSSGLWPLRKGMMELEK